MTNKEKIEKKLNSKGYILGNYHDKIENLNRNNLKKVLDNIGDGQSKNIKVFYNRKPQVIEITVVNYGGKDRYIMCMWSLKSFLNEYGFTYEYTLI